MMTMTTDRTSSLIVRLGWVCLVAGWLGVAGAANAAIVEPAVAEDRFSYPFGPTAFITWAVFFFLQHVALVGGLYGFVRSGATGTGRMGRWGGWGAVVGMGGAAVAELVSISGVDSARSSARADAIGVVYGFASVLIGVGLVLAGIAVIRAQRWHRWARIVPVLLGIYVFVPLTPALLVSRDPVGRIAIAGWMVGFAVLGWALVRKGRALPASSPTVVASG